MELTENEKETAWKIVNWLEEPCPHSGINVHRRRCQQCMNGFVGQLMQEPAKPSLGRWERFGAKF